MSQKTLCGNVIWLLAFTFGTHCAEDDVMQDRPVTRQATFHALGFQTYNPKEWSGPESDHSHLL